MAGTEVSAKYKGAFCEAKIKKVTKAVKCKVQPFYLKANSFIWVSDDSVKGDLKVGAIVDVKSLDKKTTIKATILKIQDCSQYTVVFDDGDVTSLKRTSLCLKSGKHFASSATLDQLPLNHPEHFSAPSVNSSGQKNRKPKSVRENISEQKKMDEIGKVVCVMSNDKKIRHNWFPGLIVNPKTQSSVKTNITDDYLVRSFKDGKYHSVPKKDITEFNKEVAAKVENPTLKTAVEKAMLYLDKDELPPHWDRDLLLGFDKNCLTTDSEGLYDSDNSEEESIEEKDYFVAQLFKFMDDHGTPLNQVPEINNKDVDLYKLFKVVNKFGGFNKVDKFKQWKTVAIKIGHEQSSNCVKLLYQQYLCSFEDFDRKLGCTMLSYPRSIRSRNRFSRNIIRDVDKSLPSTSYSSADKNKQSVSSKQESNEKKDKPDTIVKENNNAKDTFGIKKVTKVSKTEEKNSHKNNDESSKKSDKKQIDMINVIDTSNASRNKPLVKSDSKLKKELKEKFKKDEHKGDKLDKFDDNENSANKKNEKKSAKNLFGKSMPNPNKKDKIVKVKTVKTGLPNSRKKRSFKEQIKTFVKVMTPFKKSKKDSNNQKLQEDNIPKLTRSKSKDDFPSKSRKMSVINEPTSILQDVQTLPSGSNLESLNKVKKSDDCSEKKKSIKKKKEDVDDKTTVNNTTISVLNSENEISEKDSTPIAVGDNLVVYYGDKHTTTYDAKVLTVSEVGGDIKLYVHYKGWNSRYDEWIDVSRIASRSKGPETDIDGDSLKNEQKISDSKKSPMTNNRTRRSITPNTSYLHRKKSPLSSARPTRTCTLNDKPLSSIGKYTIRDNSDSESEYSGNLGLAKQYNKKNQQVLKTTKFDYETVVKTELSDSHGQKKTYPKTYPSKELLMQRNLPRKPKSCMIKAHSNMIEETDMCEQKTLKAPLNLKKIEDNKNVKERSIVEKDSLLQNEPKSLPINTYLCPKKDSEKQKESLTPVLGSECLVHCDDQLNMKDFELSDVLKKSKNGRSHHSSENKDKTNLPTNKELISGTDFDLNKIRSEMKGLTPTSSITEFVHKSLMIDDQETENKISKTIESDSEKLDIYEFKESEPCDFKSIPLDNVEKLRRGIKNDLPIIYNFQKSSEIPRVDKIVSQADKKNNSVSIEITEENESNRLFEPNSISGIDKYVKKKDSIKKHKLLLKNETKTEKYISQSDSDESDKSNNSNSSGSNDCIVNSPKDQVLDLCIKPPKSPSKISSMSKTNDSNAVEFDDDDESKLVIAEFQGQFDPFIGYKKVDSHHQQTENLQIESPYTIMSKSSKINPDFRSSHEIKSAMSSKECTDDESTISCYESIQNDCNFQLDSQFENESRKKNDNQHYVDNENSSHSSFEFESNLNSTIIKNPEVEFFDNNEKCIKYDYINKKKIEKESTPIPQELECKEYMSEDSLNNSLGVEDEMYKSKASKDNFQEPSTLNNINDSSLEIQKSSVLENDIFETIVSNTIKSSVIENSKTTILNTIKNSFFLNSNSISAKNSEADMNNVLFCEETIPGSPNGVSEELIDQEDKKKVSSTQYADKKSTSITHQSCNPINTAINATNKKIEGNTSDIIKDKKLFEQRNLHFLADVSNKNYDVKFDKSVLPKLDSESNVLQLVNQLGTCTKRQISHNEHEISKRAKITLNNSLTTKDGVVQKPAEMKIPLKDGKPLIVFAPEMDSAQRQALTIARMNDLRKEYKLVKARVAVVDRRRKKIRKKKRELAKLTTIQNKSSAV